MFSDRTTVDAETPCVVTLPDGRTHTARLVSARAVQGLTQALRGTEDASDHALAMARFLRHAFPWRPWYKLWGDPVPQILALPDPLRQRVLARLFFVPGRTDHEDDPIAAEIARQRAIARPNAARAERGPTLALAMLTCEERLGAGWHFAPSRWNTSDGYAPFATVWLTYEGLMARDAYARMELAAGIALAIGQGPEQQRQIDQTMSRAFPRDARDHLTH